MHCPQKVRNYLGGSANLYKGERNDKPLIQIPIEPKIIPPIIDAVIIQQKP